MKSYKYFLAGILFFSINYTIIAQQAVPKMKFDKKIHDFGTIKEVDGRVTCSFEYENTGAAPLMILKVQSSCGCTTPEWTKGPVLPGKKGFVKTTYDPKGRPGKFQKSVTVFTNASNKISRLIISGEVTARPRTVSDDFPVKLGQLRLKSTHLAFFKIPDIKKSIATLPVYNESNKDITLGFGSMPAYLNLTAIPNILKPGAKGVIHAEYDPVKLNDYGFVVDRINLIINKVESNQIFLAVSATIEEDFSNLSPQERADAPKIMVEKVVHNFGKIKEGEKISFDFKFDNKGKNPLIIRKIKSSCGCAAFAPVKNEIPGGGSEKIRITFDSKGKHGSQYHNITLVTNDPKMPVVNFKVTGVVEASK